MESSCLLAPSLNFLVEYDEYSSSIRKEYSHIEEDKYKKGRTKVLENLLANGTVFVTRDFQERFEMQAVSNMEREIASLQ